MKNIVKYTYLYICTLKWFSYLNRIVAIFRKVNNLKRRKLKRVNRLQLNQIRRSIPYLFLFTLHCRSNVFLQKTHFVDGETYFYFSNFRC